MKIFKKNYVGIDHTRKDITTAPLAFLTPYEDNAAGKKRQQSVKEWLCDWYPKTQDAALKETKIVDNTARRGFKVVDFAERYSTSNKLARIYDPDGYELEISIANLVDIMLYSSLEKGEIMCECIWVREGANNWLLPTDTPAYKSALHEGQILKANVGDIVVGAHSKRYVYLGRGYVQQVAMCGTETASEGTSHWSGPTTVFTIEPEFIGFKNYKSNDYLYYYLNETSPRRNGTIITRKKPMAIQGIHGTHDLKYDDMSVFQSDISMYHTAGGDFAGGRMIGIDIDDPHRHYTRTCRISDSPFDDTPPPFDAVRKNIEMLKK